jgi:hypothetical protein
MTFISLQLTWTKCESHSLIGKLVCGTFKKEYFFLFLLPQQEGTKKKLKEPQDLLVLCVSIGLVFRISE